MFPDMKKRYSAGTEQVLGTVADQVVDVRKPGLGRYEWNRVGNVDKQLRRVPSRRGHKFTQVSRFSILRPR